MMMTIETDLRGKLGAVRDQGVRPTCLAFAVSGAHEAACGAPDFLSTEYLFYWGVQSSSHRDPTRGLTAAAVTSGLAKGQPLETAWPYVANQPAPGAWRPPKTVGDVRTAAVEFAPRAVNELRRLLAEGTPVVLTLALTLAFFTPGEGATIRGAPGDVAAVGHHAVLAVGSGKSADGKYILVRNSWGLAWGEQGHAWLSEAYVGSQIRSTGVVIGGGSK